MHTQNLKIQEIDVSTLGSMLIRLEIDNNNYTLETHNNKTKLLARTGALSLEQVLAALASYYEHCYLANAVR